jgi:preprotein translocase subunit SecE
MFALVNRLRDIGDALLPEIRGRAAVRFASRSIEPVARVSPGEFIRQVRAETAKVVWPTTRETVTTTIMVIIMTTVLGVFFLGLDAVFSAIVQALLSLLR